LPERQRTLRATVEWSVGLLEDPERSLLEVAAVFADGWTVQAAMPGLKDRLTAAGCSLGWSVAGRLPHSWARQIFMLAADIAWRKRGPGSRSRTATCAG
jgi:hypothetical protein